MFKRITSAAFLTILMLCAVLVEAQTFSRDLFSLDTSAKKPTLDTTMVLLLVSDTSQRVVTTNDYHTIVKRCDSCFPDYKKDTTFITDHNTYWVNGFEVRYKYCCVNGNTSNLAYYQPAPYYEHHLYLNDKKTAFKPGIVVWQTVATEW